MRINRAIGLGVAIVVLKVLIANVFAALENTLLVFFHTTSTAFNKVADVVNSIPTY